MPAKQAHLKMVNLLLLFSLLAAVLTACNGQLGVDLNFGGGDEGGSTSIDNNVLALILVLIVTIVVLAVIQR